MNAPLNAHAVNASGSVECTRVAHPERLFLRNCPQKHPRAPAGGSSHMPSPLIIKDSPTVGLRPWVKCQKSRRCVCSREFRRSDVGELYPVALQTVGTSGSVRIHPRRHRRWRALQIGRSPVPEPSPVQQNTPGGVASPRVCRHLTRLLVHRTVGLVPDTVEQRARMLP